VHLLLVCYSRYSSPLKTNIFGLLALTAVETLFKHGYSDRARAYLVPNNKKLPRGIFHLYEELHRKFYIKRKFEIPFSCSSHFGGSEYIAAKWLKLTYFTSRDSESVKQKCNVKLSSTK
jgi:hypothetical protein